MQRSDSILFIPSMVTPRVRPSESKPPKQIFPEPISDANFFILMFCYLITVIIISAAVWYMFFRITENERA